MSFIFRSSILETYSLQCLDLFQSIIKLLKAINRCKFKMFWSWFFFIIWSKFSTSKLLQKSNIMSSNLLGKSFTPPHKYQSYDKFICYSIYSIEKSHMIWHVIVLNNILIYRFILEILIFNDLFSYCPSKKKSYLSA